MCRRSWYSCTPVTAEKSQRPKTPERNLDGDPAQVAEPEIRRYLLYLIDEKKISRAYLNQAISALKFYFDRVLRKPKVVGELPRPRRESTLPIILSRAKGRKDRYVPLSSVALETLCQYWKAYQLEGWLFPGARKGKHLMAEAA